MPSGLVAVITWDEGVGIVKTILTRDWAIAGMQSQGLLPITFPSRPRRVARRRSAGAREPEPPPLDPLVKESLRQLAEQHLASGIGRKARNAHLRQLGYDPMGPAGDAYRAFFRPSCGG